MDEISLIIKAPNQKYDDLTVKCQLSWTILDLKNYLCKEYPSKPNVGDQRLIYSGHLLKDEQCLHDIIQSPNESNIYTFHLVCPQRQTTSSEQSSKASPESYNLPPRVEPPSDEMNASFRSFSQNEAFLNNSNPLSNPFGPNNSSAMHESYNAMMNQYYQYMSYYYMASPPVADLASFYAFSNAYMRQMNAGLSVPPTLNAINNNNANVVNENQNQGNVPANPNNNNNPRDNEEANRDWTEMLYSFSKAMVMLSIMYFYSSFGRLLLLVVIGLVLYFYKNTRQNGAQNVLNNNDEQENDREQPQQEPANNNNEENVNNNAEPDSSNDSPNATPRAENSRYSGLRLVWVFVSSLFTSLIPDPTPIN